MSQLFYRGFPHTRTTAALPEAAPTTVLRYRGAIVERPGPEEAPARPMPQRPRVYRGVVY